MTFGLNNASGTFRRAMGVPIDESKVAVCYSIFWGYYNIFTNARRTHRACLSSSDVNERRSAKLNLKKCEFFTNHIDYTGPFILPWRLEISTWTINAVPDSNIRQARRNSGPFLGCVPSFDVSFRLSPTFALHWIKSYGIVNCRPLTDYPTKKYRIGDAKWEADRALSSGFSMFARLLNYRQWRMRQANGLCASTEATRRN